MPKKPQPPKEPDPEQIARAEALQKEIEEIVSGKAKPGPPKNLKEFIEQTIPVVKKKPPAKKKRP